MNDSCAFLIFFQQIDADLDVSALDFVVNRFADIVQKPRAFRNFDVRAEFRRHNACKERDFQRVLQHVLTVACTIFKFAQNFDKFRMNAVNTALEHRVFARFFDKSVNFFFDLIDHFFDACGVNSSVLNKFFKGDTRDFASYGVEARKRNDVGGIVDDKVNARRTFKRADIATYSTDNAPFHFIVGERDNRNGGVRCVVGGASLDCKRNNVLRFLFGVFFGFRLDLFCGLYRVLFRAVDERVHELLFCLVPGHAGDSFKFFFKKELRIFEFILDILQLFFFGLKLFFLNFQLFLFLIQRVILFVKVRFFGLKTLFGFLILCFSFFCFLIDFRTKTMFFFFCFEQGFFTSGFCLDLGFFDNFCRFCFYLICFRFSGADFFFIILPIAESTCGESYCECYNRGYSRDSATRQDSKQLCCNACHLVYILLYIHKTDLFARRPARVGFNFFDYAVMPRGEPWQKLQNYLSAKTFSRTFSLISLKTSGFLLR